MFPTSPFSHTSLLSTPFSPFLLPSLPPLPPSTPSLLLLLFPPLFLLLPTSLLSDRHVDIVRHGEVLVGSDGSLKLSEGNKVGGSGEELEMNTLPSLPDNVDQVAISWHANTEVRRKNIVSCFVCRQ